MRNKLDRSQSAGWVHALDIGFMAAGWVTDRRTAVPTHLSAEAA
jgi:hypothetical protein